MRTRSLFEPASPPRAVRRPPSASESAKARGPLPKGAAPREPGTSGDSGRGSDKGGDEKGSESGDKPARAGEGDASGARRAGMVKVVVGTRRYHSTSCPLIQGAGDSGVETMTLQQAEAAGLTSCSVCQHDRETVS